jgi:hypothetical protein
MTLEVFEEGMVFLLYQSTKAVLVFLGTLFLVKQGFLWKLVGVLDLLKAILFRLAFSAVWWCIFNT